MKTLDGKTAIHSHLRNKVNLQNANEKTYCERRNSLTKKEICVVAYLVWSVLVPGGGKRDDPAKNTNTNCTAIANSISGHYTSSHNETMRFLFN